ncbi:hypothetical protein TRVA0_003S03928 [Trichomonascus vanleenenianus]|uniref:uncharacterized protein n=1 Tax=Trichomonascus vanleenenianus TaxID=2268995 RepID=UPI003EC9E4BD
MSDDDDFMMSADEEDFDFDYDEDEELEDENSNANLENKYYNAKGTKEEDPKAALNAFQEIVDTEMESDDKTEYGFKSVKQSIKLLFMLNRKEDLLDYFKIMLGYMPKMSKNYAEKSMNNIIDYITCSDLEFMQKVYSQSLDALALEKNDRVWIKTALKLARLYIDNEAVEKAQSALNELHKRLDAADVAMDNTKSTHLLELYSLEIVLATLTNNAKKLKQYYDRTLQVNTAIPHPRILGIIRECGGKMYMRERRWDMARDEFFESFKNFDEAGSLQRIEVLRYYVLASMLSESKISPFASQETKPYVNDPSIVGLVRLVEAFQNSDIEEFNNTMRVHGAEILSDKFMKEFISDVLTTLRVLGIAEMVKPYNKVSFAHLASLLTIEPSEVQELLVEMILDDKLPGGRLNMVNQCLEFSQAYVKAEPSSAARSNDKDLPERYYAVQADEKEQREQSSIINSTSEEISVKNQRNETTATRSAALSSLLESACNFQNAVLGSGGRLVL